MSETHHFQLQSQLTDQVAGDGDLTLSTGTFEYGVPPQFGGNEGKTNPEELLLASISACFSMTLGFVFTKRKIPVQALQMQAQGIVKRIDRQLVLTAITLQPSITIADNEQIKQDVYAAIQRAKSACLISNAIRGNVEVTIEASFKTAD